MTKKQLTLIDFSKWVLWIAFLCLIGLGGYYGITLKLDQNVVIIEDTLVKEEVNTHLMDEESRQSVTDSKYDDSKNIINDQVYRSRFSIAVCWDYISKNTIEFTYNILVYLMGYYILLSGIGGQHRRLLFETKLEKMDAEATADFQDKVKEKTEKVIQEVLGSICEKMAKDMSGLPETISKSTVEIAKSKDYGSGE